MATQQEIAAHLDLTDRSIRKLLKASIIPGSKGHGGLDMDSCRIAYIRHLRGVASGQANANGDVDAAKTKAQLAAEQLRAAKRENDLAEDLVAPLDLLSNILAKVGQQIVVCLETLPMEMKRANPNLSGHDIQLVKKVVCKICNTISEARIDALTD